MTKRSRSSWPRSQASAAGTREPSCDEAEFQALIRAAPPDAIMLDLQLGASDGIEQLHFLHSVGYRGAIVLMSGFDARVLASAQQIGAFARTDDRRGCSRSRPAPHRSASVLAAIEQKSAASRASPAADAPPATAIGFVERCRARRSTPAGWSCICNRSCRPSDHAVTRAEALVRWQDPVLGLVPPEQFIPAAETGRRT